MFLSYVFPWGKGRRISTSSFQKWRIRKILLIILMPSPFENVQNLRIFSISKKRVKKIIINQNKVEGSRFQMNENMIESVRLSSSYGTYH